MSAMPLANTWLLLGAAVAGLAVGVVGGLIFKRRSKARRERDARRPTPGGDDSSA